MAGIVIIGAGMAAYSVARELRKHDAGVALTIISADAGGSYAKPMLSNAIAQGKEAPQLVSHTAEQMAATLGARILAHTRVQAIDSAARVVVTRSGSIAYDKLVIAIGAQAIRLPIGGDATAQVLSVNHLDDYAQLRQRLSALGRPARVTILGAGLIGCEFADDLLSGGHSVTLVDPNTRALSALASPSLSAGLARAWEDRPLSLRLGTTATHVVHTGDGLDVQLADGSAVAADIVVSAVGLRPHIALAEQAGIATRRGILVDLFGQTSAEHVYALGDCAEYSNGAGSTVLPYVAPLLVAARAIGATLGGVPTAIVLKTDAVVVKTPSYRMALAPPAPGTEGVWVDEAGSERTVARFVDGQGVVRGFGLSAPTPALRQALLAELAS